MAATSGAASVLRTSSGHTRGYTEPGNVLSPARAACKRMCPSLPTIVKMAAFAVGYYYKLPTLVATSAVLLKSAYSDWTTPQRVQRFSQSMNALYTRMIDKGIPNVEAYEGFVAEINQSRAESEALNATVKGDAVFEKANALRTLARHLVTVHYNTNLAPTEKNTQVEKLKQDLFALHDDVICAQQTNDTYNQRYLALVVRNQTLQEQSQYKNQDKTDIEGVLQALPRVLSNPRDRLNNLTRQNIVVAILQFRADLNQMMVNRNSDGYKEQIAELLARYNLLHKTLFSFEPSQCHRYLVGLQALNEISRLPQMPTMNLDGNFRIPYVNDIPTAPIAAKSHCASALQGILKMGCLGIAFLVDRNGYATKYVVPYADPVVDKLKTLVCTHLGPQLARFGICPQ